jgi:pimeloyl-ACP methyl ester carboxylesterase
MSEMTPDFVPHVELVSAKDEPAPERWVFVLHGIFGSGKNWRTVMRRLVDRRPAWGVALVDLRMHGESQDALGPHTIAAAAGDLSVLERALAADGKNVRCVAGHSLGGKVALRYAADREQPLSQVWVLDADPSAKPDAMAGKGRGTPVDVLEALEELPSEYESRKEFVGQVTARGLDRGLAQWLAMNLVEGGDGYRMSLDPAALRSLMASFFSSDMWAVVDQVADASELHVVLGGDSAAVAPESRKRLRETRAIVHEIVAAGHWLHVDAPDALLELLVRELRG